MVVVMLAISSLILKIFCIDTNFSFGHLQSSLLLWLLGHVNVCLCVWCHFFEKFTISCSLFFFLTTFMFSFLVPVVYVIDIYIYLTHHSSEVRSLCLIKNSIWWHVFFFTTGCCHFWWLCYLYTQICNITHSSEIKGSCLMKWLSEKVGVFPFWEAWLICMYFCIPCFFEAFN